MPVQKMSGNLLNAPRIYIDLFFTILSNSLSLYIALYTKPDTHIIRCLLLIDKLIHCISIFLIIFIEPYIHRGGVEEVYQ